MNLRLYRVRKSSDLVGATHASTAPSQNTSFVRRKSPRFKLSTRLYPRSSSFVRALLQRSGASHESKALSSEFVRVLLYKKSGAPHASKAPFESSSFVRVLH